MAWHDATDMSVVKEGGVVGLEIGGVQVALYRIEGRFYATSNICTHQYALLSDGFVDGNCIECPLHQGQFDIATGEAMGPPVVDPIATYPLRLSGTMLQIELPDQP